MTTDPQTQPFSLGLTYWPRRSGFGWWRAFDHGEVREELGHVAGLGCDTVRIGLSWEDFQPGPQRLNSHALRALEAVLDAAQAAGLRVVAALFPVAQGGGLLLPRWANGANPLDALRQAARLGDGRLVLPAGGGPALIYEQRYHTNTASDLFTDARVLEAQRYLIREVVGYFGTHPALYAWQLGEGLERVQAPRSAEAVARWFAGMAGAIREQRGQARVLGLVSAHSLTLPSGPRPAQIAAACDLLGVVADPPQPPGGARANHAAWVAFLHALTAGLGQRPTLVAAFGMPTSTAGRPGWAAGEAHEQPGWISDQSYGRPLRADRGDGEQQAMLIEQALERLQQAGASGAWLASYADYPTDLWREPPLDRAIRTRTLGLVDAQGREKLAAAALRRFAAQRHPVLPTTPLDADPERYWREPKRELARLWRAWCANE